jgi:hypothetical protein
MCPNACHHPVSPHFIRHTLVVVAAGWRSSRRRKSIFIAYYAKRNRLPPLCEEIQATELRLVNKHCFSQGEE